MVRFLELQLGVALGARQNLEELLGAAAQAVSEEIDNEARRSQ